MSDSESARQGINPWWVVALVFGGAWLVYLAFFLPIPRVEAPPPDFSWRLRDLDDGAVVLEKFRGKPIFLNVWATWCPPCVEEMPSIAHLSGRPELAGVVFLCVSVDDSADTVKRFVAGKGWPMTVLRADSVPQAFETKGIPATFIIAPNGTTAYADVGGRNWDDPETIGLLKRLQAEARSKP